MLGSKGNGLKTRCEDVFSKPSFSWAGGMTQRWSNAGGPGFNPQPGKTKQKSPNSMRILTDACHVL
jgi:hypothetical protein